MTIAAPLSTMPLGQVPKMARLTKSVQIMEV